MRNTSRVAASRAGSSLLGCSACARICPRLPNQKESREVALVVLNAGLQDFARVFAGRVSSRYARSVPKPMSDHMLHAARRVVERDRLNLGMMAKKIAALVERHRV